MISNDVLRRLRYILDYDDAQMMVVFGHGGMDVTRIHVCNLLKNEKDAEYVRCKDVELSTFLNGLIIERRGRREGPQPEPETFLTNNMILMKLKIALDLKADETLEILKLANLFVSKHELSSFLRKPGHKHYRECKDQILRNFLTGLQMKLRPNTNEQSPPETEL